MWQTCAVLVAALFVNWFSLRRARFSWSAMMRFIFKLGNAGKASSAPRRCRLCGRLRSCPVDVAPTSERPWTVSLDGLQDAALTWAAPRLRVDCHLCGPRDRTTEVDGSCDWAPDWRSRRDKPTFHLARHVTSWHDATRSTCRAYAFWSCRTCRTARLISTRSTRPTCRVVSKRAEPSGIWAIVDRTADRRRPAFLSVFGRWDRLLPVRELTVSTLRWFVNNDLCQHHGVYWLGQRETRNPIAAHFRRPHVGKNGSVQC